MDIYIYIKVSMMALLVPTPLLLADFFDTRVDASAFDTRVDTRAKKKARFKNCEAESDDFRVKLVVRVDLVASGRGRTPGKLLVQEVAFFFHLNSNIH
jgi:hypothetical protein